MDEIKENYSNSDKYSENPNIINNLTKKLINFHNFITNIILTPVTILIVLVIILIVVVVFILLSLNANYFHKNISSIFNCDLNFNKCKEVKNQKIFNPDMTYYVCSYGGSGSYMLCDYLRKFGKVEHIHSRKPPEKLQYIGSNNTMNPVYGEWFNNIEIDDSELNKYKVIYLYKNPVDAINSRFKNPEHLKHIQCDHTITIEDVLKNNEDLYKIEEFFNNYTDKNSKRNYKIYCVKYEDFWNNIREFNNTLGIPDIESLYPIKKETKRDNINNDKLYKIYKPLIDKMNSMNFIETV